MQDWTEEDGIHRATWTASITFLTGKKPLPIAPRFMEGPMVFSIGIPQVGDASTDQQGNQDEPGMGKQESHDSLGQFIHDLLGLFVGHGEQANPCQETFFEQCTHFRFVLSVCWFHGYRRKSALQRCCLISLPGSLQAVSLRSGLVRLSPSHSRYRVKA